MTPERLKLADCPFCGSKAAMSILEDEPGETISAWVSCGRCGVEFHERPTEAEAAKAWNTRAIPPDARVKEALFPDDEIKDGISMSSDAAYNLEGALYDLRRAKSKNSAPDDVCINTIERVIGQLEAARAALSHQPEEVDEDRMSPALDTATVEICAKVADQMKPGFCGDDKDTLVWNTADQIAIKVRALAAKEGA